MKKISKRMLAEFDSLSEDARIWIYQGDRQMNDDETVTVDSGLRQFLQQWAAHGTGLKASFKIMNHRHVVIAVDEYHTLPSGCSIDSSVNFMRATGNRIGIDFFNRELLGFKVNDEVKTVTLSEIKDGSLPPWLKPETLYFNNLINYKKDLDRDWLVPAEGSWLNRYLEKSPKQA